MSDYKLRVGLEVHAELKTETKMFCNSKNDPDEKHPNVNICPVCMGHPGTLPVINKEAVKSVLLFGVAVGGELADYTEFDRKNYFYPDIPKGYQISQYKHPLVSGGELDGVRLTRVHLEEDTARSIHPVKGGASDKGEESLIDFNRAGVPLMELVTEPVIYTAESAAHFAKELQLLLNYLDIAEANMEKGEMRVEANISVSRDDKFGTKVEVKNLNSFRSVERAIRYEFERQTKLLEEGGQVVQETRGWDESKQVTFSQRLKEESHDYRYFPDPDLPKLFISEIEEFKEEKLKNSLPELPWEKRERYGKKWGILGADAEVYVSDFGKSKVFEDVVETLAEPNLSKAVSNLILNEIKRPISIAQVVEIIRMSNEGIVSSRGVKEILKLISETDLDVRAFAEKNNLAQISDMVTLNNWVEGVLREEKSDVPVQFLVGQVMKKSGGRANPIMLQQIFKEKGIN